MKLSARQTYPATPAEVHAMLTDEAFLTQMATEAGAVEQRVVATAARTAVEVAVPSPAEVRTFLGPHLTLVLDTAYGDADADGARSGQLTITVPGAPVTAGAAFRLVPTASGTQLTYDGDLTVNVPLMGRSIEKKAAPEILDALAAQERAGQRWLQGR
ncbi:DUF2505 domain-containing protein [Propioniciclava soli]|uniref:DUF2505 domain-containing protein n=1 Tax=Propioniciclava soli TaxID=2775081 RepID=UPI001E649FC3|nr:DUF2505 domain-containing protein [Propioniciclava soli]